MLQTEQRVKPPVPKVNGSIGETAAILDSGAIRMTVTPDMARGFLEKNTRNRSLHDARVKQYASDMAAGRWLYNHACIILAKDGTVLDGQHRLRGCVESGKSFESNVVFGADPAVMDTIDIGMPRTGAQQLHIEGMQNASRMAACASLVLINRKHGIGGLMQSSCRTTSRTEILQECRTNPDISAAVSKNSACDAIRKLAPYSVLDFCRYEFSRQNRERADEFFFCIQSGADLKSTNPAYTLREKLTELRQSRRQRASQAYMIALFFKAWRAYRDGQTIQRLVWRNDEPFPQI